MAGRRGRPRKIPIDREKRVSLAVMAQGSSSVVEKSGSDGKDMQVCDLSLRSDIEPDLGGNGHLKVADAEGSAMGTEIDPRLCAQGLAGNMHPIAGSTEAPAGTVQHDWKPVRLLSNAKQLDVVVEERFGVLADEVDVVVDCSLQQSQGEVVGVSSSRDLDDRGVELVQLDSEVLAEGPVLSRAMCCDLDRDFNVGDVWAALIGNGDGGVHGLIDGAATGATPTSSTAGVSAVCSDGVVSLRGDLPVGFHSYYSSP
ncbi:hypothetical protein Dimus_029759 [Dionaea muscipula]